MSSFFIMADGEVGQVLTTWMLAENRDALRLVVAMSDNSIAQAARAAGVPVETFTDEETLVDRLHTLHQRPTLGLLLWWPRILRGPILKMDGLTLVNTHPSLLPYNRGKHYNFWALVEGVPFGVTLHHVDPSVDTGAIIAQTPIAYDWTDTGETLYLKARSEMIALVQATLPSLLNGQAASTPQPAGKGRLHKASELEAASRIELDRTYTARDLLNRLRARTFDGYPACSFNDAGVEFEVRVEIREKKI